ncbi:LacI family DNA-binding transcriptional regulator [Microbacterium sp. 13-71-7]|jgi:DNA-binding LacI/PurR family transcriptional regulator|uniref:LacI family DNA-binding transcriptional regulator n=1 Tax=Microbacterium sp. 13-71-7 TaxID=1970399 RepID=UPI000BCD00B3|nr:LacI family DNA-binding transcriptional regulator [Microbacterium sp. 13-71-7]OZB84601.1 MAG: hypothetical protein B7X32_06750 [Microbacterium sp. 13-71-7]
MAPRKKVTIREVAEAAGVSPATVSLVYNDKGEVAQATRDRVLAIGKELGYQPGWFSKVFRSGRSHVIGVAVVHSGSAIWERTYLPYYRGIIAGAAMEALGHGYSITAVPVTPGGALAGPIPLDGLIVVDPGTDDPIVAYALEQGMAVVAEGGYEGTAPAGRLRSVRAAVETGVPAALDALLASGATRPAFLSGSSIDGYTAGSLRAYEGWCAEHGIAPLVYMLPEGQPPIDGARELVADALGRADAVHCLNETYAAAVIAAAAEAGRAVPESLAVSVAGEARGAAVDPRLIYLELDPIESGAQCARVLIELLEGGSPDDVVTPMALEPARV